MKKGLSVLLSAILVLCLFGGCGKESLKIPSRVTEASESGRPNLLAGTWTSETSEAALSENSPCALTFYRDGTLSGVLSRAQNDRISVSGTYRENQLHLRASTGEAFDATVELLSDSLMKLTCDADAEGTGIPAPLTLWRTWDSGSTTNSGKETQNHSNEPTPQTPENNTSRPASLVGTWELETMTVNGKTIEGITIVLMIREGETANWFQKTERDRTSHELRYVYDGSTLSFSGFDRPMIATVKELTPSKLVLSEGSASNLRELTFSKRQSSGR